MNGKKLLKSVIAAVSCCSLLVTSTIGCVNAAVIDKENKNDYDNFAEALQLALCFYDANKCGDKVAEDGYYSWRADCQKQIRAKLTRNSATVKVPVLTTARLRAKRAKTTRTSM